MLNREEIQALIVLRVLAACDSCNSHHINHVEGQIRALIAVLNDGKPGPTTGDCRDIFKAANIPYHNRDDGGWAFSREWLESVGFIIGDDPDDDPEHPKFGDW